MNRGSRGFKMKWGQRKTFFHLLGSMGVGNVSSQRKRLLGNKGDVKVEAAGSKFGKRKQNTPNPRRPSQQRDSAQTNLSFQALAAGFSFGSEHTAVSTMPLDPIDEDTQ